MTDATGSSFSAEDLAGIGDNVRKKIEGIEDTLKQSVESESNWNRYRAGIEQSLYEVEQRLEACQTELQRETQWNHKLKDQNEHLETDRNDRMKGLRDLEASYDQVVVQKSDLQRRVDALSQDKIDLNGLLEKRNEEIDGLREEVCRVKNDHKTVLVQKCSMQVKLDEVQSKEVELQYREKRFEQERELAAKEQEWLKNELANRDQNIFALRKDLSLKEVEGQSKICALQDEITQIRFSYESSKTEQAKLTDQLQELMNRLKEASDERCSLQESYERELQCKTKLADVWKESASEADKRIEELTKTLESQQTLFDESKKNFFSMQQELQQMAEEHQNLMKEKGDEITNLKDELEKANELLRSQNRVMLTDEEIAAISPAAASASRLIKSGVTLTGIYREHCKVVEELDQQKRENKRIEAYFNELVQDINKNAPILRKQKEQYMESVDTVNRFKNQLKDVAEEKKQLLNARDSALRQLAFTKAELERYQRDCSDLASQVRTLLRCLEKARVGEEMPDLNDSQVLPAAEDLVLFRNIDELQNNYQRLLSKVREDEARREEIIKQAQDAEVTKLRQELQVAQNEVGSLQDHRQKQNLILETISEQRDTYKRLYQEKASQIQAQPEPTKVSPAKSTSVDESSRLLERVNAEFELYRKEKQETEKQLSAKVDGLQERLSELRSANAKLNAEVEYQAERFKVLGTNTETHAKQVKVLEVRLSAAQAQSSKQDQCVSELTREVISAREMVARLKAEKQSFNDQLQTTKGALHRTQIELDTVRKHSYTQEGLSLSLQQLQARLDRTESEKTLKVTKEMEALKTERNNLQKAYSNLNEQQQSFVRDSKAKLGECQTQLAEEETKNKHLTQKLARTEDELKTAQEKLIQLQKQIDAFTSGDVSADRYQKESQQLQNRLNIQEIELQEAKTKLTTVTEQLKSVQAEVARHTQISVGLEGSLKELTQTDQAEKAELQCKLDTANVQLEGKQQELSSLQSEKESLTEALTQLRQEETRNTEESARKINELQIQLQMLNEEISAWKSREEQARSDRDQQAQKANEMEQKLQQQLQQSSDNEIKMTTLENAVEEFNRKILTINAANDEFRMNSTAETGSLKSANNALGLEKQQLQNTLLDLKSQNESLYEQIEKLGNQISVLEKCATKEAEAGEAAAGEANESAVTPLMDVIKYAREERTKANERADKAEAEVIRIQAQHNTLEHEIDRLNKLYNETKVQAETFAETMNEKSMLSARLEALEAVQETNKRLHDEKQATENKLNSVQQEMTRTQALLVSEEANLKKTREMYQASVSEANAVKQDIQSWKKRYEQLVEQRTQFESQQTLTLRKELQVSENRVTELEQEKNRQDGEVKELKAKVEALQEAADESKSRAITLEEKITQQDGEINKQTSRVKQLQVIGRRYKSELEKLQGGAATGGSMTPTDSDTADGASEREKLLEAQLSRLREEIKATDAVKKENDALNEQKNKLQTEFERVKAKIAELEKAGQTGGRPSLIMKRMQEKMKTLDETLKASAKVASDSKTRADELTKELAQTRTENETLKKECEDRDELKRLLDESEKIKTELEKQFAEQKARLETVMSQFNRCREENARLEQQNRTLNERPAIQPPVGGTAHQPSTPVQPVTAMPSLPDRPTASTSGFNRRVAAKVSGIVRAQPVPSKARAAVPPTSTVSPGPALPDQSNNRSAMAVPPIVVSTSQQPSPSLPHAIVTPHIEPPQQQEAVSASTDAGSSGISSSSSNVASVIDVLSDEASTSTDRKRRVPTEQTSQVKRMRAESPSQVSTSGQSTSAYAGNFEQEIAPDREADAVGGDSSNQDSGGAVESSLQEEDDDVMVVEEIRPTPASSAEVASSSSTHELSFAPDHHAIGLEGGEEAEAIGFDSAHVDVDDGIVPAPELLYASRQMSLPQSSGQGSSHHQQLRDASDFPSGFDNFPASSNSDTRDVPNARQSSPPQVCLDADNSASGEVGQSGLGSAIGIMIDDNEDNYDAQGNYEFGLPEHMHMFEDREESDDGENSGDDDDDDDDIPGEIDDEEDLEGVDDDSDEVHEDEENEQQDIENEQQEMERAGEATPTPIEIEAGGGTDEEADVSEPSTSEQSNKKSIKLRKPIVYDIKSDEPPELQAGPSGIQQRPAGQRGRGANVARRSSRGPRGLRGLSRGHRAGN